MGKHKLQKMPELLLKWYDQNKRNLPWRMSKNPYCIWVSEIMLQQTRAETVIDYYIRFIKELPDVKTLADVSEERLLKLWEGLGYYSRAGNLKKAAVQIIADYDGEIPASYKELMTLPGIGAYTAGAIASIAFDVRVPAADGNVLRVMSRVLASVRDISKKAAVDYVHDIVSGIIPENRSGDFNQALMELGAVVCLPNAEPRCGDCPIAGLCQAFKAGNPQKYPVKTRKKPRRTEEKSVFIIEFDGKYLLHRRPPTGLLSGMWEFPNIPGMLSEEKLPEILRQYGVRFKTLVDQKSAKHIFTHIEWHMTGFFVKADSAVDCSKDYKWVSLREIEQNISIPSAFGAFMKILFSPNSHGKT
jgi:A/G-specific adenine glycosylase